MGGGTHTIYIKQIVPEARASSKALDATEVQQKREEILETHGNLLKRAGAESESFRPRKKYRTSVKCFNMWDHQIRVSKHPQGLWWFSKEAISHYDGECGAETWLGAARCSDQGSDIVSLVNAGLYYEPTQRNLWEYWDIMHGVNRCLISTITDEDLKPLVHLILMAINLPHGPESSDLRFKQIVDFVGDHFKYSSPRLSPFFQHLLPQLAVELAEVAIPMEGERQEDAIWRVMSEKSLYKRKGTKAHIGRYGAVVWEGLALLKTWNCSLFEATLPAVEGQMINKKALCRVKLRTSGADDASQCGPTGTSFLQEADRTLHSCGVTAMVCTMVTLSDTRNKRFLALNYQIPKLVMSWSNNANVELRKGVMANQAWLLEQTEGKLFNTLHEVFGQLLDTDLLQDGLFLTSRTRNMATWTNEEIAAEDALAILAGRMATRFVMHRSRHTLYLWGLPDKMVLTLSVKAGVPRPNS